MTSGVHAGFSQPAGCDGGIVMIIIILFYNFIFSPCGCTPRKELEGGREGGIYRNGSVFLSLTSLGLISFGLTQSNFSESNITWSKTILVSVLG